MILYYNLLIEILIKSVERKRNEIYESIRSLDLKGYKQIHNE